MDLSDHFRVIWRNRWRVLAISLLLAAIVYAWRGSQPDVFIADATLSVASSQTQIGEAAERDDTLFLAGTFAELGRARPVLADAARRSGLGISVAEARERLTLTVIDEAAFLRVSATGPSTDAAEALAAAEIAALNGAVIEQHQRAVREAVAPVQADIERLEAQLAALPPESPARPPLLARHEALVASATAAQLRPVNRLGVVAAPHGDPEPVSPVPLRDAILALLVALIVNAELVAVREALADRFAAGRLEEQVTESTGLPVLSRIPRGSGADVLEAFRILRTNLLLLDTATPVRTVALVSVDDDVGKSFCAIHLARSAAALNTAVVLVDADLRRPTIHTELGLDRAPGIGDLRGGADPQALLRPAPDEPDLQVLTAGSPVDDAAGVVGGRPFAESLEKLAWAGLVIIDTPAGALFADALAIASHCDATLIVIDPDRTSRRAAKEMATQLRQVGARPLGVILNRAPSATGSRRNTYAIGKRAPSSA